jgi:ribosomal protein S26
MAKSLRSKGVRKAKAARRLNIYKPVEDERTNRLAQAQQVLSDHKSLPKMENFLDKEINMQDIKTIKKTKLNRRQKGQIPNLYGLSKKEMKIK